MIVNPKRKEEKWSRIIIFYFFLGYSWFSFHILYANPMSLSVLFIVVGTHHFLKENKSIKFARIFFSFLGKYSLSEKSPSYFTLRCIFYFVLKLEFLLIQETLNIIHRWLLSKDHEWTHTYSTRTSFFSFSSSSSAIAHFSRHRESREKEYFGVQRFSSSVLRMYSHYHYCIRLFFSSFLTHAFFFALFHLFSSHSFLFTSLAVAISLRPSLSLSSLAFLLYVLFPTRIYTRTRQLEWIVTLSFYCPCFSRLLVH
jgi:hypothetical protein